VMTSLKAIVIVIAPLMTGIIILARPVTAIIYEHGALESSAVVAHALACYATGMIFLALNEIISKTFFSMKQSVIPMVTAIISMVFNVLLVSAIYGLIKNDAMKLTGGLALAAAGGSFVNAAANGIMLMKKCPGIIKREDMASIIKVLIATAVMAAIVYPLYNVIYGRFDGLTGNILTCAVCGAAGAAVYAVSVILLRVKEITGLLPVRRGGDK
ncbi:MAG: polysaccharide biosynthesis C-terminal domain-containing protein, partial [Clostridia bacterium]|nr:polysaccharide biosynthesis C-terminal domain-containing protein [Clostridia bacterium]